MRRLAAAVLLAAMRVSAAHASALVVTTIADDGPGSLRQAIVDANVDSALDTITFAIPAAGIPRIAPATPLPVVTGPVVIDGTTQLPAGWIELDGGMAQSVGLALAGGDSIVRGLAIGGFQHAGILITGAGNDVIEGNRIGTDASGMQGRSPFAYGIEISNSPANVLGGAAPGSGNVVSGNLFGIFVHGAASVGTAIEGNLVGTDPDGAAAVSNPPPASGSTV